MKSRWATWFFSRAPTASAPPRSRWPVLCGALVLLWCAWWYCREASQGLLLLASGLSALAVAWPRPLPSTTRWVVWSGVLLTVACLVANVTRLVPPEQAVEESRAIDRIATVAFALGLTALFFRSSIDAVTLVAVGALPMAMVVLARMPGTPGAADGHAVLIIWGLVALLVAADLAQRLTALRSDEGLAPGSGELGRRTLCLIAVVAMAIGLRLPVERGAQQLQKTLFGWVMYAERVSRRPGGDLLLATPLPLGFAKRMRVVLLIDAGRFPGYLREKSFVRYRAGRWLEIKPAVPLNEKRFGAESERREYALQPERPHGAAVAPAAWRVEVIAPALLSGFCLPGNAVAMACDGPPPQTETNGTVAASGVLPDRYDLTVAPGRLLESAYPLPDGGVDPAYLEVPAALSGAVSNWVSDCGGFSAAPTLPAAIRRVEDHFASNFTYRLGVRMRSEPDPLVDFMARKAGACTLFASAAALMFRSRGIPSRVVGGFVCTGWNPWLKRWVVREREGHAWVEVWDQGAGRWLVADPTPPDGRPASLNQTGRGRWALDWLVAGWKRLLAGLRGANFLEVLADAGETFFLFLWHVLWSIPGAVVLAGFGFLGWLRQRARRRAVPSAARLRAELAQAMRRIERQSVPSHLRRRHSESWSAWLRRAGLELPRARRDELAAWLESYQTLRYGVPLDEAAARAWLVRARSRKSRRRRTEKATG
ncbi:MAG TPA: transglutaminase-like domain-containing protein [Kiritimatiellia bacterium]|nr:transglutaminase-like domain-containing protein [Kiritimatiellia bacterium]HPS09211.1 transglutaminase-like domain-containing protein [Kiritimatiellia bacterium]